MPTEDAVSYKPIYLKPFVSAGEVFRLPGSSEIHILPMQLFQVPSGTILRIGDMAYHFDRNGVYDGVETKLRGVPEIQEKLNEVADLLADCERENRGNAPNTTYFEPGSPGYAAETGGWPKRSKDVS